LTSCSEEPIHADLSNIDNNIDTLLITDIAGYNYQISPDISSYNKLFIGSKEEFIFLSSLFNFSLNGWDTFLDSTVNVDSILFKVFSGDSLIENNNNLNLYFSTDSIFDESSSLVTELGSVDFDDWIGLGVPSIEVVIDTSDTVSIFQKTVLKWDIGSLAETIIDTSILHRTFSLSLPSDNSSFFELYSREYSSGDLDPKIEVYYRREIGSNSDSSIVDTLTRVIYVSEDISVIEALEIDNNVDDNIFISRARGTRAILKIPFDSLSLPQYSVIRSAKLSLVQSGDSLDNFSVRMDPLKFSPDSGSSIFNADPYENLGMHFSSAAVASNKLQISLKSYFQSILMTDSLTNVGLKLSSSVSNDLLESVNFDLNHVNNKLEILYVSP
tara:strand:+ start:1120 stop:2274 length:1155 start_codon:yes stop_codon:yes gene_type:complete